MSLENVGGTACLLCEFPDAQIQGSDYGRRYAINCPRCGSYEATETGISEAKGRALQHLISAWIRDRYERSLETPLVTREWVRLVEKALPKYGVLDKQLLLLQYLARKSPFPGGEVSFDARRDASVVWAQNWEESSFLMRSLLERGFVSRTNAYGSPPATVTTEGWNYLDDHQGGHLSGDQGFVAMSFKSEMDGARDAIFKGLRSAGYNPYRTDSAPHIERIDSKIIADIRNSRFLVADVTHQSQGVYFEAGFAMALGLPVFWLVQEDDTDNLHFDTRQFNHIVWRDEADLEVQLCDFVVAILGRGPIQPDSRVAASSEA